MAARTIAMREEPFTELDATLAAAYPHLSPEERRWLPPGGMTPGRTVLRLNAVPSVIRDQLRKRSGETNRSEDDLMLEILRDRSIPIPLATDPNRSQQLTRFRRLIATSGGPRARALPFLLPDTPTETVRELELRAKRAEMPLDDLACYLLHLGCRRAYWSGRRRASVRDERRVMSLPVRAEFMFPFGLSPCLLEAVERTYGDTTARPLSLVVNQTPRELVAFLDEEAEREDRLTSQLAVEILEAMLTGGTSGPDRGRRDLFRFRCWITTIDPFHLCPLQLTEFPWSTLRMLLEWARRHNSSVQEMIGFHLWLRVRQLRYPRLLA